MDNESESLVQQAIDNISSKYTVIIIANRLSTVQNATKIIVLDNKNKAEEGTHMELMKIKGIYWKLYNQT